MGVQGKTIFATLKIMFVQRLSWRIKCIFQFLWKLTNQNFEVAFYNQYRWGIHTSLIFILKDNELHVYSPSGS